jgi:hypothetical protein
MKSPALEDATWEVLEKTEIHNENLTLVPENDDWSKINAFDTHSYLDVAEKNADELKPSKRTVQPLWSSQDKTEKDGDNNDGDGDADDEFDPTTLYEAHKSQRKLAIRSSHLSKLETLKTFDTIIPGMYEMGTSKTEPEFYPQEKGADIYWNFKSKKSALITAARMNNFIRRWPGPTDREIENRRSKVDFKEYDVFDNFKKRDQNIIDE